MDYTSKSQISYSNPTIDLTETNHRIGRQKISKHNTPAQVPTYVPRKTRAISVSKQLSTVADNSLACKNKRTIIEKDDSAVTSLDLEPPVKGSQIKLSEGAIFSTQDYQFLKLND